MLVVHARQGVGVYLLQQVAPCEPKRRKHRRVWYGRRRHVGDAWITEGNPKETQGVHHQRRHGELRHCAQRVIRQAVQVD